MATPMDYRNDIRPNWCPGCGHYGVQAAIADAVAAQDISPENLAVISGIGCSSRIGGYFYTYGAHTTHGRALPYAQGVKLANEDLNVVVCGGDGDAFAIGMGHTIHAFKRNVNITYIVMDNHVYGLTKGQTSPRSDIGFVTKTSPHGSFESPLPICETAIAAGATFVAQGYMTNRAELVELIKQGMKHDGFSFINVFSPCVTYNKRNGYDYFKDNLTSLSTIEGYDIHDRAAALKALVEHDGLVTGLIYQNTERPSFEKAMAAANGGPHERALIHDVVKPSEDLFKQLYEEFK
ncbi:MAG: 2-oxoacid:ferredoxin oxidoreductase subunit beta [Veillonella sp.]|uniref:2-oxoacid:ferredoxin oxidoreductase subunit beta n=1 Tax=Veillonella sp. TaxID=1926307 RepID=UPI0025D082F9|nr:2-oxoacid:ferredoxin oxidoreductase subunit beta [Veillonella sp.]MBS4914209.1 2-oxoacid:ferredoxin oxidoreductase subunit beta [Veillonella sp.]